MPPRLRLPVVARHLRRGEPQQELVQQGRAQRGVARAALRRAAPQARRAVTRARARSRTRHGQPQDPSQHTRRPAAVSRIVSPPARALEQRCTALNSSPHLLCCALEVYRYPFNTVGRRRGNGGQDSASVDSTGVYLMCSLSGVGAFAGGPHVPYGVRRSHRHSN